MADFRSAIAVVERTLDALFPDPDIPLQFDSPFTLLIAVLLSAQCTDARVNSVTPQLFALARTPQEMAMQSCEEIEARIRTCGLATSKARYIRDLSQTLCERYDGEVPRSLEELETLPGVGHKTASVVMCQAFGEPAFPVDTHIHRCAKRWGLSSGASVRQTETDLKRAFAKEMWAKRHLQIILYARQYCPARGHQVERCPICR
ncbi:MAG: endonuclease III, partial [Chlamydiia bacterium]|nr:endonuclease III [Chlamydiia bacterium]